MGGAMEGLVRKGVIPGCSSVVLRRDKVIQAACWGLDDIERGTPFRFDSLCRLYCMTKSYVATVFMMLVDDGLISLDDRLDAFVPAFGRVRVLEEGKAEEQLKRPILMRHLLCHTSGIDYPPDVGSPPESEQQRAFLELQSAVEAGEVRSLWDFTNRVAKVPLSNQPGEGYNYGFSYDVLGCVMEKLTRKPLARLLRERLFLPLGMVDTVWSVSDDQLHRLAACYCGLKTWRHLYGVKRAPVESRKGLFRIDGTSAKESGWRQGQQCKLTGAGGFYGYLMGGLVSTVRDTVRYVQMILRFGVSESGERLLTKKSVRHMETDRLKPAWGSGKVGFIGNIGVFREDGPEYGMGGAACTYWSIDRVEEVATIWFAQHIDMPDFDTKKLRGVAADKADLWALLHEAIAKKATADSRKPMEPSNKRRRGG